MMRTDGGVVKSSQVVLGVCCAALVLLGGPAEASAADIGYRDHAFTASSVTKPSGQKPQSKLWFNDGIWWGSLFQPGPREYRIHRLDPVTQQWSDTLTPLDDRNSSEADALWDGSHLYVASSSDSAASPDATRIEIFRLTYDPVAKTYAHDPSYPRVDITGGEVEAVVLDKDSTGRLWITYTQDNGGGTSRTVFVAHTSGPPGDVWEAPYPLPQTNANDLSADDISAVVSYGGKIGVMWSNQAAQAMFFATHTDGAPDSAWSQTAALSGPFMADDHINLKSVQSDTSSGVFAAVKTSNSDKPIPVGADAQALLLDLRAGNWTSHTFGTVADDHTRPIVLTDQVTRKLYMFATSPTTANGSQSIYYKETSLDSPAFAAGVGTPFIRSEGGHDSNDVNDASSTKQDLGSAPALVILASDFTHYWHNSLALLHPAAPTATPTPAPGVAGTPTPAPGTAPTPASADRTRPVISGLAATPRSFRTRRRAGRRAGTALRYVLSEDAAARITVERASTGRRVGGGCVRTTRANRSRPACRRYVVLAGTLTRRSRAGQNRIAFSGRVGGRRLARGAHRLAVVATDAAGNVSAPLRVPFRIVR